MSAPDLNWREVFGSSENSERHLQQAAVSNMDPLASFQEVFFVLWIVFAIISIILFVVLQYIKLKIKKQREKEAAFFAAQERSEIAMRLYGESREQTTANASSGAEIAVARTSKDRWLKVQKLYKSSKSSDKKLAILEADLLLKDLLLSLGYENDSLGRMLKSMDEKDFLLLEEAWEAHKIRNELAHSSLQECNLTLATKAMRLYEKIFRHFDFI